MTTKMTDAIAKLDDATDWSDPNVYAQVLGAEPEPEEAPSQGDTEPNAEPAATAPAVAAPAPKPESSAAPAAAATAPATEEDPAGVATKDGKRVIPYAVLQSERQKATSATAQAAALAQTVANLTEQLEQAKAGKATQPDDIQRISAEEIEQLEADFPAMAKIAKANNALLDRLAQQEANARQTAAQPDPAAASIQDLIDDRPLLAKWQAKGGAAWAMAVDRDVQLQGDPAWAGKSPAERFVEVERQLADELGIPLPTQAPAATPAAPAPAAPVTAAAPAPLPTPKETAIPSLSDLGGSAPKSEEDRWASTTPRDALATAHRMTEAELMRMAGVNY
jgi:hypothetical protein